MWINRRVFLFCALAIASFSNAAQDDTKPPAWQVEGFWAVLKDEAPELIGIAIRVLAATGPDDMDNIYNDINLFPDSRLFNFIISLGERKNVLTSRLIELLHNNDSQIRLEAVKSLEMMGELAKEQIPELEPIRKLRY